MDLLNYAYGVDIITHLDENKNDKRYLQDLITAADKYVMTPSRQLSKHILLRGTL